MNEPIKLMRLITGEDIISQVIKESDKTVLVNPMVILFKRMQTGKALILMSPWIPIEIVNDNITEIDNDNIISFMNPRKSLVDHYVDVVEKMAELVIDDKDIEMSSTNEEDDEEYDELEDEYDEKEKKQLH